VTNAATGRANCAMTWSLGQTSRLVIALLDRTRFLLELLLRSFDLMQGQRPSWILRLRLARLPDELNRLVHEIQSLLHRRAENRPVAPQNRSCHFEHRPALRFRQNLPRLLGERTVLLIQIDRRRLPVQSHRVHPENSQAVEISQPVIPLPVEW